MNYKNAFPYFHDVDIDKILEEFREILLGNQMLTKGPRSKEFEENYARYTGCKFAITTNSCTTALEIVLKSIGLKENDEVIVPTQTFIATGSSVVTCGGKVVFCDSDEDFLLDIEDLKSKISINTKAVIIVHFAGLIHPQIFELKRYLNDRGIYLIEDCAHSNGAKINGIMSGNLGDFGCHSFYSTKIMTTGEGGMITTNHEDFYHLCSSIRSIGIDTKEKVEIFNQIGSNNRMPEFESILGIYQLNRLDEFVSHRNMLASVYKSELKILEEQKLIRFQKVSPDVLHPYWKFIVFLESKNISRNELKEKLLPLGLNIEAPYQPLMHKQPIFQKINQFSNVSLPNAERLIKKHFCLPIHFKLSESDAINISKIVKSYIY
jgi:perosamine synthetase